MTALLGPAWAGLVLAACWHLRPSPASRRARALAPVVSARRAADWPDRVGGCPAAVASALGEALVRRCRPGRLREAAVDPLLARRTGSVALCAGLLVVAPAAAPPAALVAWFLPVWRKQRADRRRLAGLEAGLPEVVDLLALAVAAGLSVPQAVAAVAGRAEGPMAVELGRVSREVGMGRRLGDALDDLPARAGEAVRPLVAALLASERYGAPLGPGLERLGDDVRRRRRQAAEEAARRVPVRLLFPLVTCTLPAFALLTVAPLVAGALRALRL